MSETLWLVTALVLIGFAIASFKVGQVGRNLGPLELKISTRLWVPGFLIATLLAMSCLVVTSMAGLLGPIMMVGFLLLSAVLLVVAGWNGVRVTQTGIEQFARFLPWDQVIEVSSRRWGVLIRARGSIRNIVLIDRFTYVVTPTTFGRLSDLHRSATRRSSGT